MKKSFALLLLVLALGIPVASAQDIPQAVREAAIKAVQDNAGRSDRPSNWTWVLENGVNTTDLNCPLTEGSPLGRNINVYVVTLNFSGVPFVVRVSADATLVQPCDTKLLGAISPTTADTDGDGVLDAADACPLDFGIAANQGCPQGTTPLIVPPTTTPPPTAAPIPTPAVQVTCMVSIVTETGVTSGPGWEYPGGTLPPLGENTQWTATGVSTNDIWLQVKKDGQEVWLPASSGYRLAMGKVTAQSMVYNGPSTNNASVLTVQPGTLVYLVSLSPDGQWRGIQVNNQTGWMPQSAVQQVPALQTAMQVTTTTAPGANAPAANLLPAMPGDVFELTAATTGWYRLNVNGQEAWVPASMVLPLQPECSNLAVVGTGGSGVVASSADATPAAGDGPCIVATKQEARLYAGPNFNQPNAYTPQITTPVAYRALVLINNGEWYGVFDVMYGVQYIYRDDVLRTAGNCVGLPTTQDANVTAAITSLSENICMLVPRTLTINVRAQTNIESSKLAEIPADQNLMALGKWDVWYLSTRGWIAEWVVDEERPCSALPTIEQISLEPDPAYQASAPPVNASSSSSSTAAQDFTQYACPSDFSGYMPPRISLGEGNARLSQGGLPSKLRAAPSVTGAQVGIIQPGRTLNQVINGPACSGGFVWWYVEIDGTMGWTAESSYLSQEYWLVPVP